MNRPGQAVQLHTRHEIEVPSLRIGQEGVELWAAIFGPGDAAVHVLAEDLEPTGLGIDVERIELGVDRLMTRFMARDYVTVMGREENGRTEWVETSVTHQRVKSVVARVTRSGDRFTIFGVAWSDGTPLDRVEVRVDDGDWRTATMERPDDPHTWTFFTLETQGLAPGEHTVVSRATDEEGRTQPIDLSMKRTRWENNELFQRTIQVS